MLTLPRRSASAPVRLAVTFWIRSPASTLWTLPGTLSMSIFTPGTGVVPMTKISCRVEGGAGVAPNACADEQSPRAANAARRRPISLQPLYEFIHAMVPWAPRDENRKNSRFDEEGSDWRIAKSRGRQAAKWGLGVMRP